MGSKYDKRREELYKKATDLASDGRFSKSDYESLDKAFGKSKGYLVPNKKSDLTRYIARALHQNNAVLDSDAQELANKYNKGGITQTKDSSGRLRTSFKQSTGGRDLVSRLGKGRDEWYEGEFASAPISNIEHKSWTQYGPNSPSTSKWDVYTRTYTHDPVAAKEEPAVTEATPPPIDTATAETTAARNIWDQYQSRRGEGAIPFVPTGDGIQDAANYGNAAGFDFATRFVPDLNAQADLEAHEIGQAGAFALNRFMGKVPELGDAKELFEYYSDKIA